MAPGIGHPVRPSRSIITVLRPTPQRPNVCPAEGVAVRATEEPDGNAAEHVVPQFMPVGALTITPFAPPVTFTERLCVPPPCGQPRLAGPSTVTAAELLTIKLEPSLKVAKMSATPQPRLEIGRAHV